MVEAGEYCVDIINQSRAVQSSLKEIDKVILRNHMECCVVDSIKKGKSDDVIEEVMKIMSKS